MMNPIAFAGKVLGALRARGDRREIARYFSLPYDERVRIIQEAYSHFAKKGRMDGYFERTDVDRMREVRENFRPYMDYVWGYTQVLKPKAVMQLGAFVASEAQLWIREGYAGRVWASDYSQSHLDYLREGFKGSELERIEFRRVDLEQPRAEDFADIELVAGIAVLSNIQPEGMERLLATLARSPVRCFMIGDMYDRGSLGIDPATAKAVPLRSARNWAHPYLALGRKHGFNSLFFPDFTYAAYEDTRGAFILTRGVDRATHEAAIALANRRYLDRHDGIWSSYGR